MTSTNVAVLLGSNAAPALQFEPRARALIPQTMDECARLAQICARSGLLPKSFYDEGKDPAAAAFVAIQLGAEVGLSPMTAIQYVAIVNGRPTLFGPAQLAIVQRSGLLETFEEGVEFDAGKPAEAWCRVKRAGRPEKTTRFTWAQASKAGLTTKRGPWQEYPERMMQARARTFALRDAFPDVLLGLAFSTEEMADIPLDEKARDVTPPAAAPAAPMPASAPPATFTVAVPYGGEAATYPRTRGGAREAFREIVEMFNEGHRDVIHLNNAILDEIADRVPALADEISELRAAAAVALAPKDDPDPDDLDEFGLPPLRPVGDTPDLPTDPP